MTRTLILTMIVIALGIVLVLPCVNGDDAIHRHTHHHDFSLSLHSAGSLLIIMQDDSLLSAEETRVSLPAQLAAFALRC